MKKHILLTVCLVLLVGCAAKRDRYDVPVIPLPEGFKNTLTSDDTVSSATHAIRPGYAPTVDLTEWWRILQNDELNTLMDRAIAHNPDVRIATLRIPQTLARLVVAGAARLPEISAPVRVMTEAPPDGVGSVAPGGRIRSRTTYQASLRADWRPDIWGETASGYESADFQLWRATFQRDEVQRTVAANVVATYLEYLSLNDRLRVAKETETVLSEMLQAVETRLEKGDATVTEREQQRAAVYAVRATIPVLRQQRELMQNRLASLTGSTPQAMALSENGLASITFPANLPSLPATYLLHRPDVRVMEARLLAADADIDVARARLLPPLDLTAQIGYGSYYLSELFQPHTLVWNTIANLSATIFDNGRRSGEVDFAHNVHEEMTETYVRVLYDAMREVEDAMSAIRLMGSRQEEQQIATDAARQAWLFSQESYNSAAVDYLVVLDTERTYHRNLDELYNIRLERYRGLVNLFASLGGGTSRGCTLPGKGERPSFRPGRETAPLLAAADQPVATTTADRQASQADSAAATGKPGPGDTTASGTMSATGSDAKSVTTSQPPETRAQGVPSSLVGIDWSELRPEELEHAWLVEIVGLYERSTVNAAWRDLLHRFPTQTADRLLWRLQEGRVDGKDEERAAWYRLFLARFDSQEQAAGVCAQFRDQQLRCRAVSTEEFKDRL